MIDEISDRKRKLNDAGQQEQQSCPFLDTIQRTALDFDMEPACSVSLVKGPHIYACLVCGKYFRGRGSNTPAYTHAVEESHFVFCHLSKGSFHCLPDDYEIHDASLQDIRDALHPTFNSTNLVQLDSNTELSRDLFGRLYLPGFVGLNSNPTQKTDGINAIVQALAHVRPLRDFFLKGNENIASSSSTSSIVQLHQHRTACAVTMAFGQVVRKLWSQRRFKHHVDPHTLVNAIASASGKMYASGHQIEAGEFLAWLLHQLHLGTGGTLNNPTKKKNNKKNKGNKSNSENRTSIIEQTFQGRVHVTTREARRTNKDNIATLLNEDDRAGSDNEDDINEKPEKDTQTRIEIEESYVDTHFLQLTLELTEKPLFRDQDGGLVIPQEPLADVLKKFDGISFTDAISRSGAAQRRRYQLLELPDYLILHLSRFKKRTSNSKRREKNPTIVAFPVRNLDLSAYVQPDSLRSKYNNAPTTEQVQEMSIKQLKETLIKYGRHDVAENAVEKEHLLQSVLDVIHHSTSVQNSNDNFPDVIADKYDLLANIVHDSPPDVGREGLEHDPLQDGSYKCHVQHRGTQQWYEIQDLYVQEIMSQQITVSESYVLIFERKSARKEL